MTATKEARELPDGEYEVERGTLDIGSGDIFLILRTFPSPTHVVFRAEDRVASPVRYSGKNPKFTKLTVAQRGEKRVVALECVEA